MDHNVFETDSIKLQWDTVVNRIKLYEKYLQLSSKSLPTKKQLVLEERFIAYSYKAEFQEQVKSLRALHNIPELGFDNLNHALKVFNVPEESYQSDLENALDTLDIDERWLQTIEYYLLYNNIPEHELMPKSVAIKFRPNERSGRQELFIQLFPETQKKDIEIEWNVIKMFISMLELSNDADLNTEKSRKKFIENENLKEFNKLQRKKKRTGLKKKRRAYELRMEGKKYSEIAKIIKCDTDQVSAYILRYKKDIKKATLN